MTRQQIIRGHRLASSEAGFQAVVCELAGLTGWEWYHPPVNRPGGKRGAVQRVTGGWPDLALWRPPEFVLAELKTEKGRFRPDQLRVLDALRACGLEVYVWRPSDWPEIEARLTRPREGDTSASRPALP
jgi:hypothetical protein